MPIKNYTTSIESGKTISEIQDLLVKKGASKIMTEYDPNGEVSALHFILRVQDNELPFALPIREESIFRVLEAQRKARKLDPRYVTRQQAKRIGWRILKDWVDAQLALVEIGMADMAEVFMPYLYNPITKKTLYQLSRAGQFQNLLPAVTEEK